MPHRDRGTVRSGGAQQPPKRGNHGRQAALKPPGRPDADQVTLRMLANMTAGYADYVTDDAFAQAVNQNPFRQCAASIQCQTATRCSSIGHERPPVASEPWHIAYCDSWRGKGLNAGTRNESRESASASRANSRRLG